MPPIVSDPTPEVEIVAEEELPGCWIFSIRAGGEGSPLYRLRLAWSDYDLLAPGGDASPKRVAAAVFRFLAACPQLTPLPARLDACWARRLAPDADRRIAAAI